MRKNCVRWRRASKTQLVCALRLSRKEYLLVDGVLAAQPTSPISPGIMKILQGFERFAGDRKDGFTIS